MRASDLAAFTLLMPSPQCQRGSDTMTPTFHMPLNFFSKLLNTDGLVAM